MTTFFTSRSAILSHQTCPRKRYLEFAWGGTGLSKVRATIPLATGSWTHEGFAEMLRYVQHFSAQLSEGMIDATVQVALDGYRAELAARGLDIELGEDGAYVAEEQLALVEGMLRAYAAKGLQELIEKYEVLEVEREDVWSKFVEYGTLLKRCTNCGQFWGESVTSCGYVGGTWMGSGCKGTTFVDDDSRCQVDLQARADGLLRERSTGDLYILSFKTVAGWDARRDGDARHDVQGLSEAAVIERRLQQWWHDLHMELPDPERGINIPTVMIGMEDRMYRMLMELPDPPRIMGIQMVFLIKGRREQAFDGGPYLTQSSLIRGWQREGVTDREYAWRYKWEGPDTWPDTGRLRGHTLGKGWSKFDVWTANGGVKAWVEMLAKGLVQPEIGMDPLDSTYHMPLPYFRQDRDLVSWVRQAQAQEREVMERTVHLERCRQDEPEKLPILLDELAPQYRRSCDYPSKCQFQEICFGDESMLVSPMSTGLYQARVPHHEAEAAHLRLTVGDVRSSQESA